MHLTLTRTGSLPCVQGRVGVGQNNLATKLHYFDERKMETRPPTAVRKYGCRTASMAASKV